MSTEPVATDNEESEDVGFYQQMFERYVQPVIVTGSASLKDAEIKIGAAVSPNRQELSGTYQEFNSRAMEAFVAYAKASLATKEKPDVTDEDALNQVYDWVERSINTTRKANARQKLLNDAVPPEDKLASNFANKLVKAKKFADFETAFAHVKATLFAVPDAE